MIQLLSGGQSDGGSWDGWCMHPAEASVRPWRLTAAWLLALDKDSVVEGMVSLGIADLDEAPDWPRYHFGLVRELEHAGG
jgi:hypothetical protein